MHTFNRSTGYFYNYTTFKLHSHTISCKSKPDFIEIAVNSIHKYCEIANTLKHKSSFPQRNYIVAGAFAVNLTLSLAQRIIIHRHQWHGNSFSWWICAFPCFRIPPEWRSGFRGGAAAQRPRAAAAALRQRARQDLQSLRVVRQVGSAPGARKVHTRKRTIAAGDQ